jgi:hypothetical protein
MRKTLVVLFGASIVLAACSSPSSGDKEQNAINQSVDSAAILQSNTTGIQSSVSDEFLIVPGKNVGRITYKTSIDDLREIFGEKNVKTETVLIAEGTEEAVETSINELEISWENDKTLMHPSWVEIDIDNLPDRKTKYTFETLSIGSTIDDIIKVNKGNFTLSRDDNYQFFIDSWEGGYLEKYKNNFRFILGGPFNYDETERLAHKFEFSSNSPLIKPYLVICSMAFGLKDDESNSKKTVFSGLPKSIQNYITDHKSDYCYNPQLDEFDYKKLDINNDGIPEHIIWFVGCPDTRGRGICYIFEGSGNNRIIAQYFGYEITGPLAIQVKNNGKKEFQDIILGTSDSKDAGSSILLEYDPSASRYNHWW